MLMPRFRGHLAAVPKTRAPSALVVTKTPSTTLYVLDTNVLMHDPSCIFRFEDNDVFIPMVALEELDGHKKGLTEVARNVRQAGRDLDALTSHFHGPGANNMSEGIPLNATGHAEATGKLFFETVIGDKKTPRGLSTAKADNQILAVADSLIKNKHLCGRRVVLVTKDINMRIKARILGIPVEDYRNDTVIEDIDLLYSGSLELPSDFWERQPTRMKTWKSTNGLNYEIFGEICNQMHVNQFVFLDSSSKPFYAVVKENGGTGRAVLEVLTDYNSSKNSVFGISARNREQNFALNMLMNPELDFVTLVGLTGCGKTLLTLAAGLAQTVNQGKFDGIIMTRATVPVGEDIGFLPGTEEEKMGPWMGALEDNLDVLLSNPATLASRYSKKPGQSQDPRLQTNLRDVVKVKSLSFMRGRTFLNKFVIIDEAQNLTPKQAKTLITRAGPGTKIVLLGNLAQIDTPYLTEGSSGLTYTVDRFKDWPHGGHIIFRQGERSRLANFAEKIL